MEILSSSSVVDQVRAVISSPAFQDLQHSSVRTCALATLCITTLSARVGEVCSIKALFILRRLAVVTRATCGQFNYFHVLDPPWLSTVFHHQFQDRGDVDFRWRYSP